MSVALEAAPPDLQILNNLDNRLGPARFAVLTGLLAFVLLQFLVTPTYFIRVLSGIVVTGGPMLRFVDSYIPLSHDPLHAVTPGLPQVRFRILGPAIAWARHLRGPLSASTAWIASLPCLILVAFLLRRCLDPTYTFLATLLLATLHPFIVNNIWIGYQDSLALLPILLAMVFRRGWQVCLCLFIAALADERALGAAGLLLCWHWLNDSPDKRLQHALSLSVAAVFAGLLWAGYFALMLRLTHISIPDIRQATRGFYTDGRYGNIPNAIYLTFRAAWLLPILAAYIFLSARRVTFTLAAAFVTLLIFLSAVVVADISRVMAHAFPLLMLSLYVIRQARPQLLPLAIIPALILNLISPVATGVNAVSYIFNSVPATVVLTALKRAGIISEPPPPPTFPLTPTIPHAADR